MLRWVLLFYFVAHCFVASSGDLEPLREDRTLSSQVGSLQISDFFSKELKYVTCGVKGSCSQGFDREVGLDREEMAQLWVVFRDQLHDHPMTMAWIDSKQSLREAYDTILENYQDMGFKLKNEGSLLELLTIIEWRKELDPEKYFVTGSLAYFRKRSSPRRLGEIDIVVAEVNTCRALFVGEVKANYRDLMKAQRQLHRFDRFVKREKSSPR